MIKYRWYRGLRVLFGSRSFFKGNWPHITYVIIKGNSTKVIDYMLDSGYIEEFT